ncbi:MAG: ribulose-5-phosphate 4-epimerase/fuculose-1-phosphate aldolase [Verrucomicrobiales bacterium]|jgi:ribulose-5-phosphate 4-epimerase/fuculose-1-phosphate aldolase
MSVQNIWALQAPAQNVDSSSSSNFAVTPVAGAMGAYIEGLDVRSVTDDTLDELRAALQSYKAVMLRGQSSELSLAEYTEFGERLGEIASAHIPDGVAAKHHSDLGQSHHDPLRDRRLRRLPSRDVQIGNCGRGTEVMQPWTMPENERDARIELAAAYRMASDLGWTDLCATHFSLRVPGEPDAYLLLQEGLFFEEVTASNLVKLGLDGSVRTDGATVNPAGVTIHAALLAGKPHLQSVMHTNAGVAVANNRHGLLPLSQHAMRFYEGFGQHRYEGVALDDDEGPRLVEHLGDHELLLMQVATLSSTTDPVTPDHARVRTRASSTARGTDTCIETGQQSCVRSSGTIPASPTRRTGLPKQVPERVRDRGCSSTTAICTTIVSQLA